jgi:hypothetical protein
MLITEDDVGKLERLLRRTAAAEYVEATYGIASGFRDGKRLHDRFDAHLRGHRRTDLLREKATAA